MSRSIVGRSRDNESATRDIASIAQIGQSIIKIADQLDNHENRLSKVEDTMRVNGIQEKKLTELVNQVVVRSLGGIHSSAYEKRSTRGKAYSEINRKIKNMYGIPRRGELPAKDFDDAMLFIENWTPDFDLRIEISATNAQMKLN